MSRSTSSRPSSSSRTAPPTTHASCSASTSRARSSIDDYPPRAPRVGSDAADELVVDRSRYLRVRLGEHSVAEDRDRRADALLALELDRERIHRDRADDAARLAVDPHLRPGQIAPE